MNQNSVLGEIIQDELDTKVSYTDLNTLLLNKVDTFNCKISNKVAIGEDSGVIGQDAYTTAVGSNAGRYYQRRGATAMGMLAGYSNQGEYSVAIGEKAGYINQNSFATAVGTNAGYTNQGLYAISIGRFAGNTNQGYSSIALGFKAGFTNQAQRSLIINATDIELNNVIENSCVIKPIRTSTLQSLLLGYNSTTGEVSSSLLTDIKTNINTDPTFTGVFTASAATSVSLPGLTQVSCQGTSLQTSLDTKANVSTPTFNGNFVATACPTVSFPAIDYVSFNNTTLLNLLNEKATITQLNTKATITEVNLRAYSTDVQAGLNLKVNNSVCSISTFSVAIGSTLNPSPGIYTVAVGYGAGQVNQSFECTALGCSAGFQNQGQGAIAIGFQAGYTNNNGIAIGSKAGYTSQGIACIAIGAQAGYLNQHNNSIVLNASGVELNTTATNTCVIKPIRTTTGTNILQYNPTTGEVSSSTNMSVSALTITGTISIPTYGNLANKIAEIDNRIDTVNATITVEENGFDRFYPVGNQLLRLPFLANVVGNNLNAIIYSLLDPIPQKNVLGTFDFSDFGDRSGNYQNFVLSADATFEFKNTGTIYDNALNMLTGTAMAQFDVMTQIGGQQAFDVGDGYSIVNSGASIQNTGYSFRIKYTLTTVPTANTPICGAGVMPTTHPPTGQGTTISKPCGFHLYISTGRILILYFIDKDGLACSQVTLGTALTLNIQYDITVIIFGTRKLASNNIPVECYRDKVLQTSTYAYLTNGTSETLGVVVGTESSGTRNKFVLIGKTTAVHYLNYLQVWKSELSLADITALYADDYRDYSVSVVSITNNYIDFRIASKATPTIYEQVIDNLANYNYLQAVITYNDTKLISGQIFPNINYKTCVCYYTFADLTDVSGVSQQGLENMNEITNNGALVENNTAYITQGTSLTANLSSLYFKNFLYDLKTSNGFEINFRIRPMTSLTETYPVLSNLNTIVLPIHAGENFGIARTTNGLVYSTTKETTTYPGSGHPSDNTNISSYTLIKYFYERNININKVFCGKDYTYFISTLNRIFFCGSRFAVCANTSVIATQYEPIEITFFSNLSIIITDIYCGLDMVYFKTSTGTCYVCGSNAQGQYGRNNITGSGQTPVIITAITAYATTNWEMFPNPGTSTIFLLLKTTNKLYSWGNNALGEAGTAVAVGTDVLVPTLVLVVNSLSGDYVKTMAQGLQYSFIVTNLAEYNIGKNDLGQWANGSTNTTNNRTPVRNFQFIGSVIPYCNGVGTTYIHETISNQLHGSGYNAGNQITTLNSNAVIDPIGMLSSSNLNLYDEILSVGYNVLALRKLSDASFLKYADSVILPLIGTASQVLRTYITNIPSGFITLGQPVYRPAYGQIARGCEVILTDALKLAFSLTGTENKAKLYRCETGLTLNEYNDVRIRINKIGNYISVKFLINDVLYNATEIEQYGGFAHITDSSIGLESNLLTMRRISTDYYIRNFGIMANFIDPTFLTYYQASSITQSIAPYTNVNFATISVPHPFIARNTTLTGITISASGDIQMNISLTAYNIVKNATLAFFTNGTEIYRRTFTVATAKYTFLINYSVAVLAGDYFGIQYTGTQNLSIDKASFIVITLV